MEVGRQEQDMAARTLICEHHTCAHALDSDANIISSTRRHSNLTIEYNFSQRKQGVVSFLATNTDKINEET